MEEPKKRILSGIKPTGTLNLGGYLGAAKNWVALQNEFDCFYFIADLHAITMVTAFLNFRITSSLRSSRLTVPLGSCSLFDIFCIEAMFISMLSWPGFSTVTRCSANFPG